MKPVVLFGNGMFAEMLHFYFSTDSGHKVAGFTVDRPYLKESSFCGLPVVPFDEVEKHFPPQDYDMHAGLGYAKGATFSDALEIRKRKYFEALQKQYQLVTYISSKAIVCNPNVIGTNCVIMEGCIVMPFVNIGDNAILYSDSSIGRHAHIDDHAFLAGNVTVADDAHVGEGCFISIGGTISNGVTLGKQSFIGVGAVVTHNAKDEAVFTAPPAKLRLIKSSKLHM
jgi:sugar O-acyltransferase (sialic acid O-acetyltransferase NeuD family)